MFVLPLNAAVNPTLYTLSTLVFRKSGNTPTTVSYNKSFKARKKAKEKVKTIFILIIF